MALTPAEYGVGNPELQVIAVKKHLIRPLCFETWFLKVHKKDY